MANLGLSTKSVKELMEMIASASDSGCRTNREQLEYFEVQNERFTRFLLEKHEETIRELFEKQFEGDSLRDIRLEKDPNGQYSEYDTQICFESWHGGFEAAFDYINTEKKKLK